MTQTNYTFKTTINCNSCVRAVTPFLDEVAGAGAWSVDTNDPDKVLTITNDSVKADQVVEAVEKAGFQINQV